MARLRLLVVLVLSLALGCGPLGLRSPAAAAGTVVESAAGEPGATRKIPSEFIARVFGDALGRLPDQPTWNLLWARFETSGCSPRSLAGVTREVFTGGEFAELYRAARLRLYTLFRVVHSREPSEVEFAALLPRVGGEPESWTRVVDELLAGPGFAALAREVCDPGRASYAYTGTPYPLGGVVDETALQARLHAAGSGGVVTVPEQTLVTLTAPLDVPYGVTLRTEGVEGLAGRRAYARMARLVRAPGYEGDLLNIWAGGGLENVWVDGLKAQHPDVRGGVNVLVRPTSDQPALVRWIRSDNPLGPQNVRVFGREAGDLRDTGSCAGGVTVVENFLGDWANDNRREGAHWSDGVGTACSHTRIERNEIVDASDVAVILWRSESLDPQSSVVVDNVILNAGNDAFAGLAMDPGAEGWYDGRQSASFEGAVFERNTLWTGSQVHYVIGISAGTRAWKFLVPHVDGTGGRFVRNSSGLSVARMQLPVYASGLLHTEVQDNWASRVVAVVAGDGGNAPPNTSPSGPDAYNPDHAFGILPGLVPADHDDCI